MRLTWVEVWCDDLPNSLRSWWSSHDTLLTCTFRRRKWMVMSSFVLFASYMIVKAVSLFITSRARCVHNWSSDALRIIKEFKVQSRLILSLALRSWRAALLSGSILTAAESIRSGLLPSFRV